MSDRMSLFLKGVLIALTLSWFAACAVTPASNESQTESVTPTAAPEALKDLSADTLTAEETEADPELAGTPDSTAPASFVLVNDPARSGYSDNCHIILRTRLPYSRLPQKYTLFIMNGTQTTAPFCWNKSSVAGYTYEDCLDMEYTHGIQFLLDGVASLSNVIPYKFSTGVGIGNNSAGYYTVVTMIRYYGLTFTGAKIKQYNQPKDIPSYVKMLAIHTNGSIETLQESSYGSEDTLTPQYTEWYSTSPSTVSKYLIPQSYYDSNYQTRMQVRYLSAAVAKLWAYNGAGVNYAVFVRK